MNDPKTISELAFIAPLTSLAVSIAAIIIVVIL